jgi:hypothetical protein
MYMYDCTTDAHIEMESCRRTLSNLLQGTYWTTTPSDIITNAAANSKCTCLNLTQSANWRAAISLLLAKQMMTLSDDLCCVMMTSNDPDLSA